MEILCGTVMGFCFLISTFERATSTSVAADNNNTTMSGCLVGNATYRYGETWSDDELCTLQTCLNDEKEEEGFVVSSLICPAFSATPKCKIIKGDSGKAFPNCCDKPECG